MQNLGHVAQIAPDIHSFHLTIKVMYAFFNAFVDAQLIYT